MTPIPAWQCALRSATLAAQGWESHPHSHRPSRVVGVPQQRAVRHPEPHADVGLRGNTRARTRRGSGGQRDVCRDWLGGSGNDRERDLEQPDLRAAGGAPIRRSGAARGHAALRAVWRAHRAPDGFARQTHRMVERIRGLQQSRTRCTSMT